MGRLARRRGLRIALAGALAAAVVAGCASGPRPGQGPGVWHVVRPGETVWRIAYRYGSSVDAVRRSNGIRDVKEVPIGARLWVPGGRQGAREMPAVSARSPQRPTAPVSRVARGCEQEPSEPALRFDWPLRGQVTSRFGARRGGRRHDGIDLAARSGSPIRAAESGRVIYSDTLSAYGRVVVVKHTGRWATVYAHNRRNLVRDGSFVEKGDVIAEVGKTGNATGPHVHFEIRRSNVAHDPMLCLP